MLIDAYLGRDDHLVTDPPLFHPLADELLRGLVLVAVGGVDEVAALVVEGVEELEAGLLVHRAKANLLPLVSDAHSTETERGDVDASEGGELAVLAEVGRRGRSGGAEVGHGVEGVSSKTVGVGLLGEGGTGIEDAGELRAFILLLSCGDVCLGVVSPNMTARIPDRSHATSDFDSLIYVHPGDTKADS